jgi:hypothetical protein
MDDQIKKSETGGHIAGMGWERCKEFLLGET